MPVKLFFAAVLKIHGLALPDKVMPEPYIAAVPHKKYAVFDIVATIPALNFK